MSSRRLFMVVILAGIWMLLLGRFSLPYLIAGLAVGFGVMTLSGPIVGSHDDERATRPELGRQLGLVRRMWAGARLLGLYVYELVLTNLAMARDVLRPKPDLKVGIFGVEIPALGPAGTTLLANLVTLTPGSLVLDYDERSRTLYVHTVYIQEAETMERDILRWAHLIGEMSGIPQPEGS